MLEGTTAARNISKKKKIQLKSSLKSASQVVYVSLENKQNKNQPIASWSREVIVPLCTAAASTQVLCAALDATI